MKNSSIYRYAFRYKKIDEILENITNISYCKPSKIKDTDSKIIELVSSNKQNENLLKIIIKRILPYKILNLKKKKTQKEYGNS